MVSSTNRDAIQIPTRLAQLEAASIARQIAREAGVIGQAWSNFSARVENRFIQFFLLRAIRSAVSQETGYEGAAYRLANYRSAVAKGKFRILSPISAVTPASEDTGWHDSAAIDVWRDAGEFDAALDDPSPEKKSEEPILIYVPGGGFILPPAPSQVGLAFRLGEACGCQVVVGRHRLAPEYPFPAPIHDLADLYLDLIAKGHSPSNILIAGDSAGATLVLSMLLEIRARKMPMPAGAMLFSPWADLSMRGWSYLTKSLSSDSPFRMETAAFSARLYLGETLPTDPRASPNYARLDGFPPLAIHCSRYDMHFDDAVTLAEQASDANVPVRVNYWDSPRHHLERFRSRDADRSMELAAENVRWMLSHAEANQA